jgi:hypothetical protein
MVQKAAVLAALAALVLVAVGCTSPVIPAGKGDGGGILFFESNVYGWVSINVAASEGRIHWGDSYDVSSYTDVAQAGVYSHYFSRAAVYSARLMDGQVVLADLTLPVPVIRGHVELVSADKQSVTVRHYGITDVTYWIEWGDGEATAISSREYYAFGSERTHSYAKPGTYTVGIRTYGESEVDCFTVTTYAG